MSIFISAYDTFAGSGYKKTIGSIKEALEIIKVNGQYVQDENKDNVLRIYSHDLDNLPVFGHPVVLENRSDDFQVFVDLRTFTRLDKASGDYVIRLNNESTFEINRALLNSIWVKRDPYVLLGLSPIPMIVFAGWISENIARRFALNAKEQLTLAIYSAYFYYCLFSDNDKFDDEDTNRIISSISRNLRCSSLDVIEVIDKIPFVIENITTFCQLMEDTVGSVRLKNFNVSLIYQLLGNSWFGINARELIAVSLEHPPTWIALVLSAYSERTYKNTILAKSAERKASKAAIDNFIKAVYNIILN